MVIDLYIYILIYSFMLYLYMNVYGKRKKLISRVIYIVSFQHSLLPLFSSISSLPICVSKCLSVT